MQVAHHLDTHELTCMVRTSKTMARYMLEHVLSKDGLRDARNEGTICVRFARVHHWSSNLRQWSPLYEWRWHAWNAHHALARALRVVLSFERDDRTLYRDFTPAASRIKSTHCQCCGGLSGIRESRTVFGGGTLCSHCRSSLHTRKVHAIELRVYRPLPPPMRDSDLRLGTRAQGGWLGTVLLQDVLRRCCAREKDYRRQQHLATIAWCRSVRRMANTRAESDQAILEQMLNLCGSADVERVLRCCLHAPS